MKRTRNLDRSDKWIVGVTLLCAILLLSWLVYDIAFLNPLLEGQVPVGKIYETQNRVKRKFNRSLIWYPAENNETVYENDWIFTGAQSIAKIKLDSGGGEIVIEPDSLIILSRKNGILQLDLQHGRLLAEVKDSGVKINVVKNGKLQAVKTDKGAVQVNQKSETVQSFIKLDDLTLSELADRQFYKAKEGYSDLDDSGLSYKTETNYAERLYPGQKVNVDFDWIDPYGKWSSYHVQISEDPQFRNILKSNTGKKSQLIYPTDHSGVLYWRVRGLDESGKKSKWSKDLVANISIEWIEKAEPVRLARNSMLYQMNQADLDKVKADRSYDVDIERPVEIAWEANPEATSYKVQISAKEDFSDILVETITPGTQLAIQNIQLGQTHFRVIPENNDGLAIAKPATGHVTTYFPAPPKSSLKTIDKKEYQILEWGKIPYAEAYKVTYKTAPDSTVEKVQVVSNNQLYVKEKTGFLQWKVRVVDPLTKKDMSSNSVTVDWYAKAKKLANVVGTGQAAADLPTIIKPAPRKTFISTNGSPLFIVMNWTYEKKTKAFEVEVSRNADMSQPVYQRKVVGKKRAVINQTFKPGIYYMRVRATHEKVTDERWSETEVFRVINQSAR